MSNSRRFSLFGLGDPRNNNNNNNNNNNYNNDGNGVVVSNNELVPKLKVYTEKKVYRAGDEVIVNIEVECPRDPSDSNEITSSSQRSLLIQSLSFELKGLEKLDTQWFSSPNNNNNNNNNSGNGATGPKHRRGEHVFLDCSTTSLVSNQIISSGATKKYVVRTLLPSDIPPSYKGTTIRYLYYVRSALSGQWLIVENGHSDRDLMKNITGLEARVPLQIWVSRKPSGLQLEDGQMGGIVPSQTVQTDIYWRDVDGDSEWVRANDIYDGADEGYDSSRDDTLSVSSYNPSRGSIYKAFGSSLSLQGSASRSFREPLLAEADEVLYNPSGDMASPSQLRRLSKSFSRDDDDRGLSSPVENTESLASEGYIRGRSYNIKLDDQVLLKFTPKKSDSNYCFSDTVGGTLTFFHEETLRRCLEVSITLEISETINRRFVHPSRRNSPTITKIHSDHHEVVADMVQTSFLFSIPMDGPMCFSTPHVSVQWALRFEFFTTPKNVDWNRYDHPLLVEGRDKCEWSLPITVLAPQPGPAAAHARSRKNLGVDSFWVRD